MASLQKFKVVLLGEGRTGKTSILLRFAKGEYSEHRPETTEASFLEKRVVVGEAQVELCIWDTAGQEVYHALAPIYYRGAHGAIIVYDITDSASFDRVKGWVKELRLAMGPTDISIVIAGNKTDLDKDRKVSEAEAVRYERTPRMSAQLPQTVTLVSMLPVYSYAQSVGAIHVPTSAKAGQGLEELFHTLTQRKCPVLL
jgi:Ras-related protein Rab-21